MGKIPGAALTGALAPGAPNRAPVPSHSIAQRLIQPPPKPREAVRRPDRWRVRLRAQKTNGAAAGGPRAGQTARKHARVNEHLIVLLGQTCIARGAANPAPRLRVLPAIPIPVPINNHNKVRAVPKMSGVAANGTAVKTLDKPVLAPKQLTVSQTRAV